MTSTEGPVPTLVLVGGHESSYGASLPTLTAHAGPAVVTPAGGPLQHVVTRLLDSTSGPVVVVPMTFGRDPRMIADTAKTLRWLSVDDAPRVALAKPFGTVDHLTGWLRRAATQIRTSTPDAAVVLTAEAADPFDDAELHRIAHLVRTFGAGNEIDVGIVDNRGGTPAIGRLQRLGYHEIVLVPAGFHRHESVPWDTGSAKVRFYGPIMSEQAVANVVLQRLDTALHHLEHGDTGIAAGLGADHGRGYAHSHGAEGAEHAHEHSSFINAH
jgi:sirohydrochlorin cobaltochelatase